MSGQRSRPRRRAELSQHFLRSRALAASLVDQSSVSTDDLVIEVGPGRGVLTRELAGRCRQLVAVEIDDELVTRLRAKFAYASNLQLVQGDFLRFELPSRPYKVFGNIPYSRTSAIVRRLVDSPKPPEDGYLVVQREAAQRFAGGPYAPETLASLMLKPWWRPEIARRLRHNDFDPPPAVDSVLLWLAMRPRPLVDGTQRAAYRDFIAASFGQGGNTVWRCLRGSFTGRQIGRLARDLRFDPAAQPSALSFDQWLGLFRYLTLDRRDLRGRPKTEGAQR